MSLHHSVCRPAAGSNVTRTTTTEKEATNLNILCKLTFSIHWNCIMPYAHQELDPSPVSGCPRNTGGAYWNATLQPAAISTDCSLQTSPVTKGAAKFLPPSCSLKTNSLFLRKAITLAFPLLPSRSLLGSLLYWVIPCVWLKRLWLLWIPAQYQRKTL